MNHPEDVYSYDLALALVTTTGILSDRIPPSIDDDTGGLAISANCLARQFLRLVIDEGRQSLSVDLVPATLAKLQSIAERDQCDPAEQAAHYIELAMLDEDRNKEDER